MHDVMRTDADQAELERRLRELVPDGVRTGEGESPYVS
jgi:hypothetical protein